MPTAKQKQRVKVGTRQELVTSPGPGIVGSVWFSHPAAYLLLAAWFGLLTGVGEVFLLAVKKYFLHRLINVGADIVWMTPLAEMCVFAVPGVILYVMAWRWPRRVSLRSVVFLLAFLSFLSLLFMYYPLYFYAKLLLATGLAVQAARFVARHPDWFYRLVRRTVTWIVLLVVLLCVGVSVWRWSSERQAVAHLPAAQAGAPNVLLIVLDTVRAQNLSVYGYNRRTTPRLEQMAMTGVLFAKAIATSPWTLPSHASIFTGCFAHGVSADWKVPLDGTHTTLAEALAAHGYATAGFVANLAYCSYAYGLNRGFAHYKDFRVSAGEIILSSQLARRITNNGNLRSLVGYYDCLNRKRAAEVNAEFLCWLSKQQEKPFFAFLNYFDAHEPYLPPKPFATKFGPSGPRGKFWYDDNDAGRVDKWKMSPKEIQVELDAYDGAISYLDHHVGLLFDELDRRGLLGNTMVIITSDHGEQFGEHGLFSHGNSLYLPNLHVPLLIIFPSHVPGDVMVSQPVSLRDLPATVMDILGLEETPRFPGTSLVRYWRSRKDPSDMGVWPLLSEVNTEVSIVAHLPDWYPVSKGDMKSLLEGRYHYIKNGDGTEELYDVEMDPLELCNLIGFQEQQLTIERFRNSLKAILAGK